MSSSYVFKMTRTEVIKRFRKQRGKAIAKDAMSESDRLFVRAIHAGNLVEMEELFARDSSLPGRCVNAKTGDTTIHAAIAAGHLQIVR